MEEIAGDIMTVEEVSDFLGFSRSKIYKMIHDGQIPAFKVSRSWRFSRKEILLWIDTFEISGKSNEISEDWKKKTDSIIREKKEKLNQEIQKRILMSQQPHDIRRRKKKEATPETPMSILQLLKKTGLFAGFEDSEIHDFIIGNWPRGRSYRKGEIVLLESEKLNSIYVVDTGCLAARLDSSDVDEPARKFFRQASIIGLDVMVSDIRTAYMEVWAEQDTNVIMFDSEQMMKYMYDNPSMFLRFATNALKLLSDENIRWMKQTRLLMEKNVRSKILYYLRLEEKKSDSATFTLDEGRQGMAKHLGINRNVLTRELVLMKEDGIIDYEKNNFIILKRPKENREERQSDRSRGREMELGLKKMDENFESSEERDLRLGILKPSFNKSTDDSIKELKTGN